MTPSDIDRVFGRSRLRIVTGNHVEVFRESSLPGERRRYTKRFLATPEADFREWTEREWRILARLVGHGITPVPDIVQYDRGASDRPALVQTYDAGITVDHWAALLPLARDGVVRSGAFEDCAHWWALARHSLIALDAIHELRVVHLDLKADNICIAAGPPDFDPFAGERRLHPRFDELTLIDFAFSLVSGEHLDSALPIAAQRDYEYQSPRLLRALESGRRGDLTQTWQLDWRCDFFSLAAMLGRYLPEDTWRTQTWTAERQDQARQFVDRLTKVHDAELPSSRPHAELIALTTSILADPGLQESLRRGWTLAIDARAAAHALPTPITRIAAALTPLTQPVALPGRPAATTTDDALPAEVLRTPVLPQAPSPPSLNETPRPEAPLPRAQRDAADKPSQRQRPGNRRLGWIAGLSTAAVAAAAGTPLLMSYWTAPGDTRTTHPAALSAAPPRTRPASPEPSSERRAYAQAATPPAAEPLRAASARPPVSPPSPATAVPASPRPADTDKAPSLVAEAEKGSRSASPAASPPKVVAAAVPARAAIKNPTQATRAPLATAAHVAPKALPMPPHIASANRLPYRTSRDAAGGPAKLVAAAAASPTAPFVPSQQLLLFQARIRAERGQTPQATSAQDATVPTHPVTAGPVPQQGEPTVAWAVAGRLPSVGTPVPAVQLASAASSAASSVASPSAVATAAGREGPSAFPASAAVDFGARANGLMVNDVPRLAQRAQRLVSRVLFVASHASNVVGDPGILETAGQLGGLTDDPLTRIVVSPRDAQRLDDGARSEYARRGPTPQGLSLQVQAFGANPLDAGVVGDLAFLLLQQRPAQAEAARQLALHALTLGNLSFPRGRPEDWNTLAIASALTGRDRDARNALRVSLALTPNLERYCQGAIDIYSVYGERVRGPVEAVLRDASASARTSPPLSCEWPPRWALNNDSR
jgi:hypothetical protein